MLHACFTGYLDLKFDDVGRLKTYVRKDFLINSFLRKNICKILTIILVSGYFIVNYFMNFEFYDYDYHWAIHQDEKTILYNLNEILNIDSFSALFHYLFSHPFSLHYGKIFFYLNAIFALPFNYFLGESGTYLAIKILQSSCIVISYLLLTRYFINNKFNRLLALFMLFIIPSTIYYSITPKPEPILLLSLTIYLILNLKLKRKLSSIFFLGLAQGVKISIFPGVLFIALLGLMGLTKKRLKYYLKCIGVFICGLYTAETFLIQTNPTAFKIYLSQTLFKDDSEMDSSSVNTFTWLEHIFSTYFNESRIAGGLFFLLFLIIVITIFHVNFKILKDKTFSKLKVVKLEFNYLYFISFSFLLPIILFIQRIFDFYLYIGLVLLVIATFNMLENSRSKISIRVLHFFLILTILFIGFSFPEKKIKMLSNQKSSEHFIKNRNIWKEVKHILSTASTKFNQNVCISADLYYRYTFDRFKMLGSTRSDGGGLYFPYTLKPSKFIFNTHSQAGSEICDQIIIYKIFAANKQYPDYHMKPLESTNDYLYFYRKY